MKIYNKLVRDNVPQFIEDGGNMCYARRIQDTGELHEALERKMMEEAAEFIEKPCVEEAGDMIEVIRALCALNNLSFEDALAAADRKKEISGGFTDAVFLERVIYEMRD